MTKPGGRFLFIDVTRHPWMPRYRGPLAPDGLASQTELRGLLVEAGFRLERWRALPVWLWLFPTVWATAHKVGAAGPP